MKFNRDPRQGANQSFWDASKNNALEVADNDPAKTPQLQIMFADVEVYRKIVLNPLSHSASAAIVCAEIHRAIEAVAPLSL